MMRTTPVRVAELAGGPVVDGGRGGGRVEVVGGDWRQLEGGQGCTGGGWAEWRRGTRPIARMLALAGRCWRRTFRVLLQQIEEAAQPEGEQQLRGELARRDLQDGRVGLAL